MSHEAIQSIQLSIGLLGLVIAVCLGLLGIVISTCANRIATAIAEVETK